MSDHNKDSKDKENPEKLEGDINAENEESDSDIFDWILDKGWLRTKK